MHLLHLLGNLALDAVVGNAVVVCHHLKDALLGLAGDAVFVAGEYQYLVVREFLASLFHFLQYCKVVVGAVDVCTAYVLHRGLGTRLGKEVDGLQHVVAYDKLQLYVRQMFVSLIVSRAQ